MIAPPHLNPLQTEIMHTYLLPLLLAAAEVVVAGPSLISILIWLLVFLIVVYLAFVIVQHMPVAEPWKTIIVCIVALILLLVLLSRFGLF
jgi:hypothetical protein